MNVTVIGRGKIGTTLGKALAAGGHEVTLGSRPDVAAALVGAEAVVLAVPGPAVADVVREHADALAGLLIVDATNTMGGGATHSRDVVLRAVPTARYARAFNTLGVENFAAPRFHDPLLGDVQGDLFYSVAEADIDHVEALITAVGLRPIYLGEGAEDVLDGVLRLWFSLSRRRGRHLAFRVLDDSPSPTR